MSTLRFYSKAKNLSSTNLRYLADVSKLVYQDPSHIELAIKTGKYGNVQHHFIEHRLTHTQALAIWDKRKVILAFRGTEGAFQDWATDAKCFQTVWMKNNPLGEVHSGFFEAKMSVWNAIKEVLEQAKREDIPIWLTGHSLGGALANLSAATLLLHEKDYPVQGIYTFGQPRVGDFQFAENFNKNFRHLLFRFVNNNDVVTRVPPQIFGYSHVGQLHYFDHEGKLHPDGTLSWWARFWDRLHGRYKDLFDLDLDGISDHAMQEYINCSINH